MFFPPVLPSGNPFPANVHKYGSAAAVTCLAAAAIYKV